MPDFFNYSSLFGLIFGKAYLICGVLGVLSGILCLYTIKHLPQYLYHSWQREALQILKAVIPGLIRNPSVSLADKVDSVFHRNDTQSVLSTEVKYKKIFLLIHSGLFLLCAYNFSSSLMLIAAMLFISILNILIVIDYKTMLLPDELTLPLIWLGLLFNLHGLMAGSLTNAVYGAIGGYLSLWLVFWSFKLLTKKDGMGYGDFKLLAAILAFLGLQYLVPMLLLSSILGIAYFIIITIRHKIHKTTSTSSKDGIIAFGPYLGGAAIILLFAGNTYIQLI